MKKKSLAIIFLVSSFIVNNNYSQFNTVIRNYHSQKEESNQLKNNNHENFKQPPTIRTSNKHKKSCVEQQKTL